MKYEIKRKNIKLKNSEKKIKDSLVIVGLDEVLLDRKINTLSISEQKIVQLAISLISNPEVIIIEASKACKLSCLAALIIYNLIIIGISIQRQIFKVFLDVFSGYHVKNIHGDFMHLKFRTI